MFSFTLRQLQYFVAVAETGSISAAAQQLHVSHMAVGQGLDELERVLRVSLTVRVRSRGVTLTPAGQSLLPRCVGILNLASALPGQASFAAVDFAARLRIGVFPTIGAWAIPPIVDYFALNHPQVGVEIEEGDFEELQSRMSKGDLDLALGFRNHVAEGVEVEEVLPLEVRGLVSSGHPLASMKEVPIGILADWDIALLTLSPIYTIFSTTLVKHDLMRSVRWRSENMDVIRNLVGRGLAVGLVASPGLLRFSSEGRQLETVRFTDELPSNALVALKSSDASTFADVALQVLRDLPTSN